MEYRTLGRTGIRVSVIGMGCEGMVEKSPEIIREYVDEMERLGVNLIDLYSPDPQLRDGLGQAMQGRRGKFVLQAHMCSIWQDGQYKRTRDIAEVRDGFMEQLRLLRTDHVEIGMIHYVDSLADWDGIENGPVLKQAVQWKNEGLIQSIGLSSHNPQVALKAVETGLIDVLMFSVNPCYDLQPASEDVEDLWAEKNYAGHLLNMDPDRQKLYETCQRMGVAITVMKAFGGGDLMKADISPAGKALTLNQCIQYALDRPGAASVLCGARTVDELREDADFVNAPPETRDYAAALASFPKISWEGHCMYCGHCAPCPRAISVADVTKFLNLTIAQGMVPETVREHYAALEHKAGECIQCGACEARCPFHVFIRENMKRAASVFGS